MDTQVKEVPLDFVRSLVANSNPSTCGVVRNSHLVENPLKVVR